ncbi:MAG: hypothetical protein NTV86_04265 [Planctomycetota bacterium]|nr:hypothetical protein [Planctomycetota bacterium]
MIAYLAKVGANTSYIIHPDETLADNFALLLLGRSQTSGVPTPRLLAAMHRLLSAPPASAPAPASQPH